VLWEAADRICGKRLKAALPLLLDSMEKYGHLKPDDSVRLQLLTMSAATIDRRLRSIREQAYGGRKKKRAALNRIRKLVPVRTFADWGEPTPGFFEMDMVVHCGERAEGSFVHSLVLTDVASGWTECIALPVREQAPIVEAVDGLRARLPFAVLGIDTDNDSAFLNDILFNYCRDQGITLTRSRAYHKNDQAWVEQKNGSVVRKLVGYGRLEGLSATAALRRLYESSRLYTNFFQPSFKLTGKTRRGARVHKTYDEPLTPYTRLPTKQGSPAGSALYAQERGRAVWHPALFRPADDATRTALTAQNERSEALSSYHRNLLFGSLQAESLGLLISYTSRLFDKGKLKINLSCHHRNLAASAAECLRKLYIGDKGDTWRSASLPRQIDHSCYNDLRKVLSTFSLAGLT
jgi:hypothetical protein